MLGNPHFTETFCFDFAAIFKLNFLKHFGYDYYASAPIVASQLNWQIIFIENTKVPSNPQLNFPFKRLSLNTNRQIGDLAAVEDTRGMRFGQSSSSYKLSRVGCAGTEDSLDQCPSTNTGDDDCVRIIPNSDMVLNDTSDLAGVRCARKSMKNSSPFQCFFQGLHVFQWVYFPLYHARIFPIDFVYESLNSYWTLMVIRQKVGNVPTLSFLFTLLTLNFCSHLPVYSCDWLYVTILITLLKPHSLPFMGRGLSIVFCEFETL